MDRAAFKRQLQELIREKCGCRDVPAHLMERVRTLLYEQRPR